LPTSRIIRLRFPDGDSEVRSLGKVEVGAVVRTRGGVWVVTSIAGDIVDLAAAQTPESNDADDASAASEPPATPASDEPMFLQAPLTA
jgi:hypothetical protein